MMASTDTASVERAVQRSGTSLTLQGITCQDCGRSSLPPRSYCPSCGSERTETITFDREATLETYSIVHVPQEGFEAPYGVGFVRLSPDDVRVFTPIGGESDQLAVGDTLELSMLTQADGMPHELWGFRPASDGAASTGGA